MTSRPLSSLEISQCQYIDIAPINAQIGIRIAAHTVPIFLRGLHRAIARHPRLRMTVVRAAQMAVYQPQAQALEIRHIHASHPGEIQAIADVELNQHIPLHRAPLLRIACVAHNADHVLILTFCHLVIDGRSLCALVDEALNSEVDPSPTAAAELLAVDDVFDHTTALPINAPDIVRTSPYQTSAAPVQSCRVSLTLPQSSWIFSWARRHGAGVTAMLCSAISDVLGRLDPACNRSSMDFMVAVDARRYVHQICGIGNYATAVCFPVQRIAQEDPLRRVQRLDQAMKAAVSAWRPSQPPPLPIAMHFCAAAALVSNLGPLAPAACIRDIWLGATGGDVVRSQLGAAYAPHIVAWTLRGKLTLAVLYRAEALRVWGSAEAFLQAILARLRDIAQRTAASPGSDS